MAVDPTLSALAAETAEELGVVGAQVAVARGGTVREGVTGVESLRGQVPVAPDTLFQIGSTTKVHTAVLCMQLVEEGRIGLDDPVADQLPGFRLADDLATKTVTPRHLMSMSSGIDNGPYVIEGAGDDALARYVDGLAEVPVVFAPGHGFGYSNASTCVTGRLVAHVLCTTWEDALRERLLEPAGLGDSWVDAVDVIVRPHALGHRVVDRRPEQLPVWSVGRAMGPAGTLCSTAGDLVRFGRLFCDGGRAVTGHQLLQRETVAAMTSRVTAVPPTLLAEWWGLGPYGKVWDGVEVLGHSGTNLSGSSYLLWCAERDLAVATTVNTPALGYAFAARVFEQVFRDEAGVAVPPRPAARGHVAFEPADLVGRYEMSESAFTVSVEDGVLQLHVQSTSPGFGHEVRCRLLPLTPRTFLATDPAVDGGRGWALAFEGPEGGRAERLVNGFFALRRTS